MSESNPVPETEPETPVVSGSPTDLPPVEHRVSALEDAVTDIKSFLTDHAPEVEGGIESTVQGIVDFLHRLFPGHGAPGVPTPQLPVGQEVPAQPQPTIPPAI